MNATLAKLAQGTRRLRHRWPNKNALRYDSVPRIREALAHYQVERLARGSAESFEAAVRGYAERERVGAEGYPDRSWFGWGHDHDFGTFQISGLMGTRHVWMLSRFLDHFGVPLDAIRGRRVLDVGCWSGGVSLVLSRLGAEVVGIDPVLRHLEAAQFLRDSFAVETMTCRPLSIYDVEPVEAGGGFDTVFCMGVIYHHTDPVVALRRLYNAMRPGAWLCLETMSTDVDAPLCEYRGPYPKDRPRESNWFIPAPRALERMLKDAGFEQIRVGNGVADLRVTGPGDPMGTDRCFAVARRLADRPFPLYGPSVQVP